MNYKSWLMMLVSGALCACSVNVNRSTPKPVSQASVVEQGVYAKSFNLANGQSIVLSEGRLEPRSIGSMSVKLYRDLNVGDFVEAISLSRDGTILNAVLIENGEYRQKLAITTVTAGSGNYQQSQMVCIEANKLTLC
ncbi:PliI family lysozyme inhibitor of I-type lysozyme [Shewanella waksmanii]|uniref:PliI family lysozyme inhibitor of I-type lysozyme n=1 Tax=Shewanella waksmanii TaxID=213783 RepID=UPI003735983F